MCERDFTHSVTLNMGKWEHVPGNVIRLTKKVETAFSGQPSRTWDLSPTTARNCIQPKPRLSRKGILSCGFQKGTGSCWHLDFSYLRSVAHRFVVISDTINRKLIKSYGDRKHPCFILSFMKKHEVCHHWVWY